MMRRVAYLFLAALGGCALAHEPEPCARETVAVIEDVAHRFSDGLRNWCVGNPPRQDAAGLVPCELVRTAPGECPGGCRLVQLERDAETSAVGWRFEPTGRCDGNVHVVGPPIATGRLELVCEPPPMRTTAAQVGDPCNPSAGTRCGTAGELACDPFAQRCEHDCETDADCGDGRVCDLRTPAEYWARVPPALAGRGPRQVCIVVACDAASRR